MRSDQKQNEKPRDQESKDENIVKHIVQTGLPPGIKPDEAKDPGADTTDKRRVENRS